MVETHYRKPKKRRVRGPLSQETKDKIAEGKRGYVTPELTKDKIRKTMLLKRAYKKPTRAERRDRGYKVHMHYENKQKAKDEAWELRQELNAKISEGMKRLWAKRKAQASKSPGGDPVPAG